LRRDSYVEVAANLVCKIRRDFGQLRLRPRISPERIKLSTRNLS